MNSELRVGHYHPVWLPKTMTWLYRQILELEALCSNSVYTEITENRDIFPFDSVYTFENEAYLTRISNRLRKKIGKSAGLKAMMKKIQKDRIQLIHSHFGHVGITGTKMARELGLESVVTFYGMDLFQIPKRYPALGAQYSDMFDKVSVILCEGSQMAESVISMGADRSKVVVHPLGIELEAINHIKRTWNNDQTLKILIAASFRPKKGIPTGLRALAKLGQAYKIEITIVGDAGMDQVSLLEKDNIFKAVKECGLEENTHFLGFKSHEELLEIAKYHHLFLQPSLKANDGDCEGGVPVTLIELAAQGLQVVSTYHCDIPSVIEHGKTGWLAPEKNIDELVRVLFEAVENPYIWSDISINARKHIESNYDAKRQALALFDIYNGVLNG